MPTQILDAQPVSVDSQHAARIKRPNDAEAFAALDQVFVESLNSLTRLRDEHENHIGDTFASYSPEQPRRVTRTEIRDTTVTERREVEEPRSWSFLSTVCFLLAAFCFWSVWSSLPIHFKDEVKATSVPTLPAVVGQSRTGVPLMTRTIGSLDVCQWVLAENPKGEQNLEFGADVNPPTWKLMSLRALKVDGSTAYIRMIRPDWWLAENDAEVNGSVYISVPECGIDGNALIVAIQACPRLLPRPGPEFCVITAVFRHENARVLDLRVDGLDGSIGTTPNHPFWSEDRQKFVRADDLQPGETLRTADDQDGLTTHVVSLTTRPGRHVVYNLEVQADHVYHVSTTGVLVHNGGVKNCAEALQTPWGMRDASTGRFTKGGRGGVDPVDDFIETAKKNGYNVFWDRDFC